VAREAVVFKGTRHGITIQIDEDAQFQQVLTELREKLDPARDFFLGASVKLVTGRRSLATGEQEALMEVAKEYGLTLTEVDDEPRELPESQEEPSHEPTLLVRRTIRSGQRIHYPGHVVILGDVNPGAEVVAAGDIVILGTLRGMAHAGASGDENALVIGLHLEPTQLRIAGFICRSPDEKPPLRHGGPEMACVQGDVIVIRTYDAGQLSGLK
jgi:septum site-determining protein MinC